MASAVARTYNGGLGAEPLAGIQGVEPEAFFSLLAVQRMQEICIFCSIFGV